MNPFKIIQGIAGKNTGLAQTLSEVYKTASELQKSVGKLKSLQQVVLDYLQENNIKVQEMLPHLQKGSIARGFMDSVAPGIAPKLQAFGDELLKKQEEDKLVINHSRTHAKIPAIDGHRPIRSAENRFLPLKKKR